MPNVIPMGWVPTELFQPEAPFNALESAIQHCLAELPEPGILCTACDLPPDSTIPRIERLMGRQDVE